MTGIYKISNKDNGKVYIGKSKDIMQRWSAHERALQANNHHSPKLQMDFNNYGGIEAFEFSIIEICAASELNDKEKYYINKFDSINNGYNVSGGESEIANTEIVFTNESYEELLNRLGGSCIMTYFYLRFRANDKKQIVLNQSALADYFGVSVMTINKHIRTLLDNSIIRNIGKQGVYNVFEILI